MASRNTTTSPNARQRVQRSNTDSIRWIVGLLLLCVGVFAAVALFSSFFCWEADQSILRKSSEEPELFRETVRNWCGGTGARLGILLVDRSLGVCGILVPVVLMLVGIRIIRQRPMLLNHSVLALCLVMILGSLTLGFVAGTRGSLCCSTGWGGAFGIAVAELLSGRIGTFGTVILLLVCWILVGVFINRNFINTVNSAGQAVVGRGERLVESFRQRVASSAQSDNEEFFYDTPLPPAQPVQTPAPAQNPVPQEEEPWFDVPQEEPAYQQEEAPYTIPPSVPAVSRYSPAKRLPAANLPITPKPINLERSCAELVPEWNTSVSGVVILFPSVVAPLFPLSQNFLPPSPKARYTLPSICQSSNDALGSCAATSVVNSMGVSAKPSVVAAYS